MSPRKTLAIAEIPRTIGEVIALVDRFMGGDDEPDTMEKRGHNQVKQWVAWTVARGYQAIPANPQLLSIFLGELARRGYTYITIHLCVLRLAELHLALGLDDPRDKLVKSTLRKIKRELGVAARSSATPLTRQCFDAIRATISETRDGEYRAVTIRNAGRTLALMAVMRDAMLKPHEARALEPDNIREQTDGSGLLRVRLKDGGVLERFLSAETMSFVSDMRDAGDEFPRKLHQLKGLIQWATQKAGLEGQYTSWSPRLGMAIDLLDAGESIVAVMVEGRWGQFHQLPPAIRKKMAELDGKRRERLLSRPNG